VSGRRIGSRGRRPTTGVAHGTGCARREVGVRRDRPAGEEAVRDGRAGRRPGRPPRPADPPGLLPGRAAPPRRGGGAQARRAPGRGLAGLPGRGALPARRGDGRRRRPRRAAARPRRPGHGRRPGGAPRPPRTGRPAAPSGVRRRGGRRSVRRRGSLPRLRDRVGLPARPGVLHPALHVRRAHAGGPDPRPGRADREGRRADHPRPPPGRPGHGATTTSPSTASTCATPRTGGRWRSPT
jgi:hypothetical protein